MEKITANYRIVTPMFIGDAEQNASGISPSSIKGSLRFWWRALNWNRYLNQAQGDENQALHLLHQHEATLFGSTAEKDNPNSGQGAFILRVTPQNLKILSAADLDNHPDYNLKTSQWHSYFLGLGLMEYQAKKGNFYQRSAIVSGTFTLQLFCRTAEHSEELKQLLLLWGLFGGLGSRSRKGFGSISISELTVSGKSEALPKNQQELIEILENLFKANQQTSESPYSAFSKNSRLIMSEKSSKPAWQQLGSVAKAMQLYRGWGYKTDVHRINNEKANHEAYQHKVADHELVYQLAQDREPPRKIPDNLLFGLPRSYSLSSQGRQEIKLESFARLGDGDPDKNKRSRRAAPLFIHVHQFENDESLVMQLFLPARFLPEQDVIKLKRKNGEFNIPVPEDTDWQVINEYLSIYPKPQWQELKHGD